MGVYTDKSIKKAKYEPQWKQPFDWRNVWLKKDVPVEVVVMFMPNIKDDREAD